MRKVLAFLIAWLVFGMATQAQEPTWRAGSIAITAGDIEEPGDLVVPRLQDNAGMIHIDVDPSYPAFLSAQIVLEWIRTNRLVIENLTINTANVTVQGNRIRIRFTYDFIFGQDFVTQSIDFRGTDQFVPVLARFNFHRQKISQFTLNIEEGRLPTLIQPTAPVPVTGTLSVQSNVVGFEVSLTDSTGVETIYRPRTDNLRVVLTPGPYELVARSAGNQPIARSLVLTPGSVLEETLQFVPEVVVAQVVPPPTQPIEEPVQTVIQAPPNRTLIRLLLFTAITGAGVYGGFHAYNSLMSGSSGLPAPPGRP